MTEKIYTSTEIFTALGCEMIRSDWHASGVSIDSRSLNKGDLFFALTDIRDGHNFVADAEAKGAAAAIVEYKPEGVSFEFPLVIVPSVKTALENLAKFSRKRFSGKVIAITGSVGKTSAKDMLAHVLNKFGKVHSAERSYNNQWGVPLTLARLPQHHDYAIIEIGMNQKGEIGPLSYLAKPHLALITNIGYAHMAAFEDLDSVAFEKSMIFSHLTSNGVAIIPGDSPGVKVLIENSIKFGHSPIQFGSEAIFDSYLKKVWISKNQTFVQAKISNLKSINFQIGAVGVHHAKNAIAILTLVDCLGYDIKKVAKSLVDWSAVRGRGAVTELIMKGTGKNHKFHIIDETYNSNPTSVMAALEVLVHFDPLMAELASTKSIRRVAILGDMLELGEKEIEFHKKLAESKVLEKIDLIHCIGPKMRHLYCELRLEQKGMFVTEPLMLLSYLQENLRSNDVFMLKGSLGSGLSVLSEELIRLSFEIK